MSDDGKPLFTVTHPLESYSNVPREMTEEEWRKSWDDAIESCRKLVEQDPIRLQRPTVIVPPRCFCCGGKFVGGSDMIDCYTHSAGCMLVTPYTPPMEVIPMRELLELLTPDWSMFDLESE